MLDDNSGVPAVSARLVLIQGLAQPTTFSALDLSAWDRVLREARASNLLARLASAVHEAGLSAAVPVQVQPHLLAARRLSAHQLDAIRWECRHLEQALGELGIPVILLKGAAYAMAGLAASRGRLFGDIDLLVPRDSLNRVEAALRLHGWSAGVVDAYDDRYYRRWMHELPPLVHLKRGTTLDVHHNILPLTAADVPDAAGLIVQSLALPDSRLHVLRREDLVIHSAVHLFHEGETVHALRDLLDLQALCADFAGADPGFWNSLVARARTLKLVWPTYLAVRYLGMVLAFEAPPQVRQELHQASAFSRPHLAFLDFLYRRAFLGQQFKASGLGTAVARGVVYLRSHWLRMPLLLLCRHLGRKGFLRLFKSTSRTG